MSVEEALSRDLRRLRRAAAVFMVLLMLLPWFFRYVPASYPSWRVPRQQPQEMPAPEPVPETYPVPVQWIPFPVESFARWIQERYPGSLVGVEELTIVNEVARQWNINPGILISIVGAEHSFLAPRIVGWEHALKYYENPFSYGVYPGSKLPFAIGWQASASGAASIISRVIRTMPEGEWSAIQWAEFWRRLSGYYVRGDVNDIAPVWLRNVAVISQGLWQAALSNPELWARTVLEAIPAAQIPGFVDDLLRAAHSIAQSGALQQAVAKGLETFNHAVESLQTWFSESQAAQQITKVAEQAVIVLGALIIAVLFRAQIESGVAPVPGVLPVVPMA